MPEVKMGLSLFISSFTGKSPTTIKTTIKRYYRFSRKCVQCELSMGHDHGKALTCLQSAFQKLALPFKVL